MAKRKNRVCFTCGEKYVYCSSCNRKDPTWMAEFHEENCKNIFQICTNFNVGIMNKSEAKSALEQCDLSNKESFKDFVQHDLEVIFAEESKKRGKKPEADILDASFVETHEVFNKEEE